LSVTEENDADLDRKHRTLIQLAHTKTDSTSAQCFLNWNTSDFSLGLIAFGLLLGFWLTRSMLISGLHTIAVPLHATEALGDTRYSSYSFTTSALDGGEWSASRPGRALPPGNGPPVPIVQ
jgi:hypothetical protein